MNLKNNASTKENGLSSKVEIFNKLDPKILDNNITNDALQNKKLKNQKLENPHLESQNSKLENQKFESQNLNFKEQQKTTSSNHEIKVNQQTIFGGSGTSSQNPVGNSTTPHIIKKPMVDVGVQSKLLSKYVHFVNPQLQEIKNSSHSILLDDGCNGCLASWTLYRWLHQNQLIIKEETSSLIKSSAVFGKPQSVYLKITFNLQLSSPFMKKPVIHQITAFVSSGELNTGVDLLLGTTYMRAYGISDATSFLVENLERTKFTNVDWTTLDSSFKKGRGDTHFVVSDGPEGHVLFPVRQVKERNSINEAKIHYAVYEEVKSLSDDEIYFRKHPLSLYALAVKIAKNPEDYTPKEKKRVRTRLKTANLSSRTKKVPTMFIKPRTRGQVLNLANPFANKPLEQQFIAERNDKIFGELNVLNTIVPKYVLLRPDSKMIRVSNPTNSKIEVPITAEPWYIPVVDLTAAIQERELVDVFEVIKECREKDLEIIPALKERGIEFSDLLEFLKIHIDIIRPEPQVQTLNVNVHVVEDRSKLKTIEKKGRFLSQEQKADKEVQRCDLKSLRVPSPLESDEPFETSDFSNMDDLDITDAMEKIKEKEPYVVPLLDKIYATPEEVDYQYEKLKEIMKPSVAEREKLKLYSKETDEALDKIIDKMLFNCADQEIKGFLRNPETQEEIQLELNAYEEKLRDYVAKNVGCRIQYHDRQAAEEHIALLLKRGLIEEGQDTRYLSPLMCVHQGEKKRRFVLDLRKNNELLIQDNSYPLPSADDILASLQGSKCFSKLDLAKGFHQLKMAEKSRPFTAFQSPTGKVYQYIGACFGLHLLPSAFSQVMHNLLKDFSYTCTMNFIDDVMVYAKEPKALTRSLSDVVDRLVDANVTFHASKCSLYSEDVTFLGFKLSEDGVSPDPEKVRSIKETPLPKTQFDLQSFLGLANFYRKFIPDFSTISAPMRALIHEPSMKQRASKVKLIEWNPEAIGRFEELRSILASSKVVLAYPDYSKEFILTTDSSLFGHGGVLSQIDDEGNERPLAFASAAIPKNKRSDPPMLLELRAIIFAVSKFENFLRGAPKFRIKTDSLALVYLDKINKPTAQFIRWRLYLSQFKFTIEHVQGKYNVVSDCLSRNPRFLNPPDNESDNSKDITASAEILQQQLLKKKELEIQLKALQERDQKDLAFLTEEDAKQKKKLERELHQTSRSTLELEILLKRLQERYQPLSDLVSLRNEVEKYQQTSSKPFLLEKEFFDTIRLTSNNVYLDPNCNEEVMEINPGTFITVNSMSLRHRATSDSDGTTESETGHSSDEISENWRSIGSQVAIKEIDKDEYHFGSIVKCHINPLLSCNPNLYRKTRTGRNIRLTESEKSHLNLKPKDIVFYKWYDANGKYIYPALNIVANFKGRIKSVPEEKNANSLWTVQTPEAYNFPATENETRTEHILRDPVIYEVKVPDQHDPNMHHTVYVTEDEIDSEVSQGLNEIPEDFNEDIVPNTPWFDNVENEENTASQPTTTSTPVTSDDNDIDGEPDSFVPTTEDDLNLFNHQSLQKIHDFQRVDPSLKVIFDRLESLSEEEGSETMSRWKNAAMKKLRRKREGNEKFSKSLTIEEANIIGVEKWNGVSLSLPEGEYFIDTIDGVDILKVIRTQTRSRFYDPVVVIPRKLGQSKTIKLHKEQNHCGMIKLYNNLAKYWYWKGMYLDCKFAAKSCTDCQKTLHGLRKLQGRYRAIVANRPNQVVAMDLLSLPTSSEGHNYALNIIDYLSRYAVSIPIRNKEAETVHRAFWDQYICKLGMPDRIVVDQGSEFKNELMKSIIAHGNIQVTEASTARHETVGLVERYQGTLNRVIKAMSVTNKVRDWSKWLPSIAYKYNLSSHEALNGESPFYVRHGIHDDDRMVKLLNSEESSPISPVEYIQQEIPSLMEKWKEISRIIEENRNSDNGRKNKNRKDKIYSLGQRVLLWWPRKWRKEGDPHNKFKYSQEFVPAIVTSEITKGKYYSCHTMANKRIETIIPVAHMKPYIPGVQSDNIRTSLDDDDVNVPNLEVGLLSDKFNKDNRLDVNDNELDENANETEIFKPLVFTGDVNDHFALGLYFRSGGHIWRTFYLNYHQKYKQRCLWCTCESTRNEYQMLSRVISFKHFMDNYYSQSKRCKEDLVAN